MKRFERLVLFVLALAVGGVVGDRVLSSPGALKWLAFMAICVVLGEVFHQIDQWICERHKK